MSGSTDATSPEPPTRLSDPQLMPQRVYLLRAIGMGMGVLPMAAVLVEIAAPWWSWAFLAFTGLLWPHLAFLLATRSRDPTAASCATCSPIRCWPACACRSCTTTCCLR
jgi:hypothetical protein